MRVVRFSPLPDAGLGTDPLYGVLEEDNSITVITGDPIYQGIQKTAAKLELTKVRLLAPVIPRSKIVAIGKNYADHIEELAHLGYQPDGDCVVFMKPASAAVPVGDVIPLPKGRGSIHHEAELVVMLTGGGALRKHLVASLRQCGAVHQPGQRVIAGAGKGGGVAVMGVVIARQLQIAAQQRERQSRTAKPTPQGARQGSTGAWKGKRRTHGENAMSFAQWRVEFQARKAMGLRMTSGTNESKPQGSGYTYADAGVSIAAGNALVKAIAPLAKATARPGADAELGGFGGFFDLKAAGYTDVFVLDGGLNAWKEAGLPVKKVQDAADATPKVKTPKATKQVAK